MATNGVLVAWAAQSALKARGLGGVRSRKSVKVGTVGSVSLRRLRRTVQVLIRKEPSQNSQQVHDTVYMLRDPASQHDAGETIARGLTDAAEHAHLVGAMRLVLGTDAQTLIELSDDPAVTAAIARGDLDHPFAKGKKVYDVTFENVQAGLRTDYLFRLANKEGGMVVGTGDLSELALGWCTYGVGDHMSHYNVNGAVAKTLIQHLIRWSAASGHYPASAAKVMRAILEQEISPELVPAGADGKIQSTEDTIGPYNLHDFFLNQVIRWGSGPARIAFLAHAAWGDAKAGEWPMHVAQKDRVAYDMATIVKWLEVFTKRSLGTHVNPIHLPLSVPAWSICPARKSAEVSVVSARMSARAAELYPM